MPGKVRALPAGYHTITPNLAVKGAAKPWISTRTPSELRRLCGCLAPTAP